MIRLCAHKYPQCCWIQLQLGANGPVHLGQRAWHSTCALAAATCLCGFSHRHSVTADLHPVCICIVSRFHALVLALEQW